jgi:hypothetical protein
MDKVKEARMFLQSLNNKEEISELIRDRVGEELNDFFFQQAAIYSKSTLATDDPKIIRALAAFMLMGYLTRTHHERKEMSEKMLGGGDNKP